MTQTVKVIAKFVSKKTGEPLTGEKYTVRIYDNDVVSDDFLGEGKLNNEGVVEILTDLGKALSVDSPAEKKPDLYFEVYSEHGVIYQSKVFKNVDFLQEDTKDFGTFEIVF
ncbi:MAG: hypothetical protein KAT34_20415 [Candidatus Aminicenantes bacterium]|nr:hypothetical protein [Candidatus Aminicenantes bacterium]